MTRSSILKVALVGALAAFAAAGGALFAAGASADGTTVSAGSGSAQAGSQAGVNITAADIGVSRLGAWTIDIVYDPAVVSVVGCAPTFGGVCNMAYHANTVRIAGVSALGLDGTRVLGTITFACDVPGKSGAEVELPVFADATPGGPQPIDAKTADGSVTCTAHTKPTATPTAKPTATPDPAKLAGDANCDHQVNALDAVIILQYAAVLLNDLACPANADYNHDGQITSIDAALVLQQAAGLI